MTMRTIILRCLIACLNAVAATPAVAAGIYSQIVATFPTPRVFHDTYNKAEHALVLEFQKTSPNELQAFESYDERLVRRVVMKDLGPSGTEVKLILRDRDVRAMVNSFQEPFRVTVDLFDSDYEEERDPQTGMPLVQAGATPTTAAEPGQAKSEDSPKLLVAPESSAPKTAEAQDPGGKKKLLQPMPELFTNPEDLETAMRGAADGIGKGWKDYPPYVYRIQTAPYEEKRKDKKPSAIQALSSVEAMSDYAGKLYNFGHEGKALLAYQQVLHKDPTLFDKDALSLWKFAETHLGQGNLTLARGYYEALVEKHPESPLASFGRMRILDVAAVRMLQQARPQDLPQLLEKLAQIKPRANGELVAQLALRKAYWSPETAALPYEAKRLPPVNASVANELAGAYPNTESSRTGLLAASVLLNDMVRMDTPWNRATGPFAEAYFKRFSGDATEPYRTQLKDKLHEKLNKNLQAKVTDGKLIEAIDDYEALPAVLKAIKKTPKTAWALAEAYRKLGQPAKAVDLYAEAAKTDVDGPDRFKAEFWLAVTAGELAAANKSDKYAKQSRDADKAAEATWKRMKDEERQALEVAYKEPFEKTVTSPARLRTGPKIVLASWSKSLGTKASAATGDKGDWGASYSPSGAAVILLSDLGKRFAQLGMPKESREARGLLKHMTPKDFEDDKAAKALWAKQLVDLAEDFRQANQYLDAGRLFSLVGSEAENWEGRAEALYKGGLLLYRAGRREEAMEAFKKAGDDGNNLFYANLAKERMAQMQ